MFLIKEDNDDDDDHHDDDDGDGDDDSGGGDGGSPKEACGNDGDEGVDPIVEGEGGANHRIMLMMVMLRVLLVL